MMLHRVARVGGVAALLLLAGLAVAQVSGIAPKILLDPKAPTADKQVVPGDKQVHTALDDTGLTVTVDAGNAEYPGFSVKSDTGTPWNLTPWGHIEAKITNLGEKPLSLGLRVDNAGEWRDSPWSAENAYLKAGESKVAKVIFGYSYGFKPSYKLNPGAVTQILIFAIGKSDTARVFRVEALQAAGAAGEQPPVDPSSVRVKPDNGVIFGAGAKFDAAKQLVPRGATAVVSANGALNIEFVPGSREQAVVVQSVMGSWDLSGYYQVQVRVKNNSGDPLLPRVRLESKGGASSTITPETPIPAHGEGDITVPFAPAVSAVIPTDPRQDVKSAGSWAEQNWGPKKGTGTSFTSGWVKGITILPDTIGGTSAMSVLAITAVVPTPTLPEWLGTRPPVDGDWVKTFDENFTAPTLDLKTWNIYTDNFWDKRTHFSKDNIFIKDGKLYLHYEKKTGFHNDDPQDTKTVGKTDYACGFADTYGKWVQRYGYFEARMKLPKAPGLWPAFWTMPDRGKDAGPQWKRADTGNGGMELDIMEHLTGWGPYRYNLACHWDGYTKEHKSAGTTCVYMLPDKDGYITAGVYWVPGLVVYYVQGREVMRWESPRVCSVPSYLMFDMVSGGWDNVPLEDAKLPDDFVIDYVRAWQRKDLVSPVDGPQPNDGGPSSLK
jgi:beta-glucanase (GH16 family)